MSFLYHIYAKGEIEQLSEDADAVFERHALPARARRSVLQVPQGGSPDGKRLDEVLALLKAELSDQPIVW